MYYISDDLEWNGKDKSFILYSATETWYGGYSAADTLYVGYSAADAWYVGYSATDTWARDGVCTDNCRVQEVRKR